MLSVGIMDKNYKDCNVPWIKMWTSYLMDSEHFKPYDADINNCHQFIQRVCRRVELRTNKFTFVDEKIAKKARGQWWNWIFFIGWVFTGCDSAAKEEQREDSPPLL